MHINFSPYCWLALVPPNFMKFGVRGQLTDLITCVKFLVKKILVNRFRGYRVLTPQNCPFPLTCCVALTTVYVLPCDTVMNCYRNFVISLSRVVLFGVNVMLQRPGGV